MPSSRNPRQTRMPDPQSIRRFVEPLNNVVSLAEQKLYMRVDETADDTEITAAIAAATKEAEDFTRRAFITQQWRITFNAAPFDLFTIPDVPRLIELPRPEIQSLDKIETVAEDGTVSTFALTNVIVDINSQPGKVTLKPGSSWPTGLQIIDAIRFEYTAGYGDTSVSVPLPIVQAIKKIASTMYEHREDVITGTIVSKIPQDSVQKLSPYRIMHL